MIIAFVIDVCDDETQDGLSLLDVVKNGIRNFLEVNVLQEILYIYLITFTQFKTNPPLIDTSNNST
jgi:hypothetical protein